MQSNNDHSV